MASEPMFIYLPGWHDNAYLALRARPVAAVASLGQHGVCKFISCVPGVLRAGGASLSGAELVAGIAE